MRQKKLAELKSLGTRMQSREPWTIYMQSFEVQWLDGHSDSSIVKGAGWTRGDHSFCGSCHHRFMEHLVCAR